MSAPDYPPGAAYDPWAPHNAVDCPLCGENVQPPELPDHECPEDPEEDDE